MEASTSSSAPSVPLTLRTSIPGLELPPSQYLVPVSFARSHLSTLVNRLLQQSRPDQDHQSTPFDFIVDGQLLRDSLQNWLDKNGKTIEEGVELEYVKSTLPPRWAGAFQHDDWIASIDASREGAFLTASYDSCIRLFDYASPQEATLTYKVPSTSASAPQSLVAARWVKEGQIATAGMDGAVRLFSVPSTSEGGAAPRQLWWGTHHPISVKGKAVAAPKASMGMQPSALTSLDVAADGTGLVTASRDGSVAYWRFDDVAGAAGDVGGEDEGDEEDGARKRRKAANGKSASSASGSNAGKRPSALFWHSLPTPLPAASAPTTAATPTHAPHATSRVSSIIFSPTDPTHRALSAGYDGKVIEWDLFAATHGGNPKLSVRQTSDSRSILCMAGLSGGARVVTGQMDRSLAFWDLSAAAGSSTVVIPNAHAGPIYSVSAHPSDAHLFASAGGEGVVKVWDTRSHKRALFTLQKPATAAAGTDGKKGANGGGKLLACEWDRSTAANAEEQASSQRGQVVLAGGEDCAVNVFRGQGIGA